jgi:CheY-like chemotaxis protein
LTAGAGATGAPLSILLVLPSPPLRLLAAAALRAALEPDGPPVTVVEAGSALEALWLLGRRGRPTLALVALDMPGVTGDELVTLLRARPEHRNLPVVAVAPASDAEAPARAAAAGAAALLRTPFAPADVSAALAAAGLAGGPA